MLDCNILYVLRIYCTSDHQLEKQIIIVIKIKTTTFSFKIEHTHFNIGNLYL